MYTGTLTKMDADDAFTGDIASLDFDIGFTMVPNAFKAKDSHPDYVIEARSPRGRSLRIGSGWASTSRAGNDYYSLAFNLPGQSVVRVNAVRDEEASEGVYRLIPMVTSEAA